MLLSEIVKELNKQMNLEFYSSSLYLQMSAWSSRNSFLGTAKFFLKHSKEEMDHMMKLFQYLDEVNSMPLISSIDAPISTFSSLHDVIKKAYDHEKKITKNINYIINESLIKKDYLTFNFLQWYISEQNEEEKIFKSMYDSLLFIGNTAEGLFILDKEFGKKNL